MQNEKAIQELLKLNNTELLNEELKGQFTQSSLVAIPDNFTVKNLEPYMQNRDQFRATMSTASIEEFVRYNGCYAVKEASQCFIDSEEMTACSVFDLGTVENAGHCRHKANLSLKKTAPFKALLDFNGARLDQRQASEWIEDYSDFITAFDSEGEEIKISDVSAAIRSLTVRKEQSRSNDVQDFQESRSQYEQVKIETKEGLKMPAVIKFTCEPYNGLDSRCFELRHSQIDSRERPQLVFRIKRLEVHEEDMAAEFKEKLDTKLTEEKVAIDTFVGSLHV